MRVAERKRFFFPRGNFFDCVFFHCLFLSLFYSRLSLLSTPSFPKYSVVLVPRVLALGTLVEHRRPLVRGTQLHRIELESSVPALDARLVNGRADPRCRVGRAARRLICSGSLSVHADGVWPQRSELVPPAVVVDVDLADDGDGLEVCFFFFLVEVRVEVFVVEARREKN